LTIYALCKDSVFISLSIWNLILPQIKGYYKRPNLIHLLNIITLDLDNIIA